MKNLIVIACVIFILIACNRSSNNTFSSCIDLSNKLKSLPITEQNIISPQNTDLPKDSITLDIYEIIDQYDSNIPSLKITERIISCKGKAKLSEGNYPIEFYLLLEDKDEFIVVESQGKRKWIFKWKI